MFRRLMDALLGIEKRYAVGLLGLLIGIPSLYIAFDEKRPAVTYDIVSETNVLDVNAPVRDLVISYQGENIAERNLNLRIYMLRVENTGEIDITQNLYDMHDVFGMLISSGRIVESPRVVRSNSQYLIQNLRPRVRGNDTIAFNKTILDRGAYAILEVRILHTRNSDPRVRPIGKIAGVKEISVTRSFTRTGKPGYLARAFGGGVVIQAFRTVAYPLGALALIVLTVIPVAMIGDALAERKRRKRKQVVTPLVRTATEDEKLQEYLIHLFSIGGVDLIASVRQTLKDEQARRRILRKRREMRRFDRSHPNAERRLHLMISPEQSAVMKLMESSHAEISDSGDVEVSQEAHLAFQRLEVALRDRGILPTRSSAPRASRSGLGPAARRTQRGATRTGLDEANGEAAKSSPDDESLI